jgi:hypothetical protein
MTGLTARAERAVSSDACHAFEVFGWPKTCACGRRYERHDWLRLAYIGVMRLFHDEALDLRNCACGSTLSAPEHDVKRPSVFDRHRDALRIATAEHGRARGALQAAREACSELRARLDEVRRDRESWSRACQCIRTNVTSTSTATTSTEPIVPSVA